MEYPNAFALFLLVSVILSLTGARPRKKEFLNASIENNRYALEEYTDVLTQLEG